MATRISDTEMTSDVTRHTARAAEGGGWTVSWLPGRTLTQNQAVTAMTIAEAVIAHADDLADNGSRWWLHIDQWAAELGITGPNAVADASLSPEDRAAIPAPRPQGDGTQPAQGDEATASTPVGGTPEEPFDVRKFARSTVWAYEFGEDYLEQFEDRVIRLEEVIAARWPRSLILRWRLAREIRASVADRPYPRGDFHGRRVQWAGEQVSAIREERDRARDQPGQEHDT